MILFDLFYAASVIEERLRDLYHLPVLEYEIQRNRLKQDISEFLDLHMFDFDHTSVLVLCSRNCIKELFLQVKYEQNESSRGENFLVDEARDAIENVCFAFHCYCI